MTRFGKPLIILAYHGLVQDTRDVLNDFCFVTPQKLQSDLTLIRSHGWDLVNLSQALGALKQEGLGKPSVAITFDDGLKSVIELGAPVFQCHTLAPTIFLPSELSEQQKPLWYTRVIKALRDTPQPAFTFLGRRFCLTTDNERSQANVVIQNALRALHPKAVDALVEKLSCALMPANSGMHSFPLLTPVECRQAVEAGHATFGAHSATHAIHSHLNEAELTQEISSSVAAVARIEPSANKIYAFPNGRRRDFSARCFSILQRHGVSFALSTIAGWNTARTNPFALKRFCVGPKTDLKPLLESLRWRLTGWVP